MNWIWFFVGMLVGGTGGALTLLFMQAISDHKKD